MENRKMEIARLDFFRVRKRVLVLSWKQGTFYYGLTDTDFTSYSTLSSWDFELDHLFEIVFEEHLRDGPTIPLTNDVIDRIKEIPLMSCFRLNTIRYCMTSLPREARRILNPIPTVNKVWTTLDNCPLMEKASECSLLTHVSIMHEFFNPHPHEEMHCNNCESYERRPIVSKDKTWNPSRSRSIYGTRSESKSVKDSRNSVLQRRAQRRRPEWPCTIRGLQSDVVPLGGKHMIEVKQYKASGVESIRVHLGTTQFAILYRSSLPSKLSYQMFIIDDMVNAREYFTYTDIENAEDRQIYATVVEYIHWIARKVFNVKYMSYPGLPMGSSFYRMANGDCRLHPSKIDKQNGMEKILWDVKTQSFKELKSGVISKEIRTAFMDARNRAEKARMLWLQESAKQEPVVIDYGLD